MASPTAEEDTRQYAVLHFLHLFGVQKVVPRNVMLYWPSPTGLVAPQSISIAPTFVAVYKLPLSGRLYQLPIALW